MGLFDVLDFLVDDVISPVADVVADGVCHVAGVVGTIEANMLYGSDDDDDDDDNDFSGAEYRRQRLIEEKKREIAQVEQDVNQHKINRVNGYLKNRTLIEQPGISVSVDKVLADGNEKLDNEESAAVDKATNEVNRQIAEIEAVIAAIDEKLQR